MEQQQERVCPKCGGTHSREELTLTFKGELIEAIELMAARRKESVEQFLFHLLWLESSKVKQAREILEKGSQHDHGEDK